MISDSVFQECKASGGGVIAISGASSILKIENSSFERCKSFQSEVCTQVYSENVEMILNNVKFASVESAEGLIRFDGDIHVTSSKFQDVQIKGDEGVFHVHGISAAKINSTKVYIDYSSFSNCNRSYISSWNCYVIYFWHIFNDTSPMGG